MKEKLLNLFLNVYRFTVLTISNDLLNDEIYMALIAEVLLDNLRTLRKQAWVKTPTLAT